MPQKQMLSKDFEKIGKFKILEFICKKTFLPEKKDSFKIIFPRCPVAQGIFVLVDYLSKKGRLFKQGGVQAFLLLVGPQQVSRFNSELATLFERICILT